MFRFTELIEQNRRSAIIKWPKGSDADGDGKRNERENRGKGRRAGTVTRQQAAKRVTGKAKSKVRSGRQTEGFGETREERIQRLIAEATGGAAAPAPAEKKAPAKKKAAAKKTPAKKAPAKKAPAKKVAGKATRSPRRKKAPRTADDRARLEDAARLGRRVPAKRQDETPSGIVGGPVGNTLRSSELNRGLKGKGFKIKDGSYEALDYSDGYTISTDSGREIVNVWPTLDGEQWVMAGGGRDEKVFKTERAAVKAAIALADRIVNQAKKAPAKKKAAAKKAPSKKAAAAASARKRKKATKSLSANGNDTVRDGRRGFSMTVSYKEGRTPDGASGLVITANDGSTVGYIGKAPLYTGKPEMLIAYSARRAALWEHGAGRERLFATREEAAQAVVESMGIRREGWETAKWTNE